jgi:DnaJ-domain-containing protein 1
MGRLLIFLGLILAVIWLLYWFKSKPPAQVARTLRKTAFWGVIAVLVVATATGRLNPLLAALAAMVPVLMRLLNLVQLIPGLQRAARSLGLGVPGAPGGGGGPGGGNAPGQTSSIRTRFLAMTLDHSSGAMDGEVLEGPFAGQRLSALELEQLLRMLELYREADAQSASVLEAYLDRERDEDWREQFNAASGPGSGAASGNGAMSRAEALAILGLEEGADAEAIRAAHRRLMQKLHPDRGGSDYLAAKINEAKRVLLDSGG